MREIAYFMLETRAGEALSSRLGSRALRWETPRLERFLWRGYRVSLYLFPCRLEGTKRLHWWMERIGSALEEQGTVLWLAPELEAAWEDWQPPLPDAALAAEILRGQPFRENLVLLADAEKTAGQWSRGREKRYQSRVSFLAGGLFAAGVDGFKRVVSGGAEGSGVGAFFRLAVWGKRSAGLFYE